MLLETPHNDSLMKYLCQTVDRMTAIVVTHSSVLLNCKRYSGKQSESKNCKADLTQTVGSVIF